MLRYRYTCVLLLLALILTPALAADLTIDMGPTLGDLTPNSALLTWHTNKPAVGWVEVAGQKLGAGEPTEFHRVRLAGLLPGRGYGYTLKVKAGDESAAAGPYRFRTPSPWLSRWSFAAYGDTRTHPDRHREVVAAMAGMHPRLVLNSGDLVSNGQVLDDWYQFFPVNGVFGSNLPLYPAIGNHERNADLYYQLLPLPPGGGDFDTEWYTFTYGNCQFFVLDSSRRIAEQTEWLREVLAQPKPPGVDWRIAMFHAPAFSSGPHGSSETIQEQWCPLLEDGGVAIAFSGDDHFYERSLYGGVQYIVVGTGGAPTYQPGVNPNPYSQFAIATLGFCRLDVTPNQLSCVFIDTNQKRYDEFTITR